MLYVLHLLQEIICALSLLLNIVSPMYIHLLFFLFWIMHQLVLSMLISMLFLILVFLFWLIPEMLMFLLLRRLSYMHILMP